MTVVEKINAKIYADRDALSKQIETWRQAGDRIVFTNGCFDLIHLGHVDYLARAADQGNRLVVALNSDASTNRLKGPNRPIQDEKARLRIMASFQFTDAVILFDEPTPYELIKCVQPDFLVKGSDYKAEDIVGYDIVTARGGKVVTLDFIPGYSTTLIEKRIRSGS